MNGGVDELSLALSLGLGIPAVMILLVTCMACSIVWRIVIKKRKRAQGFFEKLMMNVSILLPHAHPEPDGNHYLERYDELYN